MGKPSKRQLEEKEEEEELEEKEDSLRGGRTPLGTFNKPADWPHGPKAGWDHNGLFPCAGKMLKNQVVKTIPALCEDLLHCHRSINWTPTFSKGKVHRISQNRLSDSKTAFQYLANSTWAGVVRSEIHPLCVWTALGGSEGQGFGEEFLEWDAWDWTLALSLPSLGDLGKLLNYFLPQFPRNTCWHRAAMALNDKARAWPIRRYSINVGCSCSAREQECCRHFGHDLGHVGDLGHGPEAGLPGLLSLLPQRQIQTDEANCLLASYWDTPKHPVAPLLLSTMRWPGVWSTPIPTGLMRQWLGTITIFPQDHEALPFLSELRSVISLISNLLSCFAMTCDSFMYLKIFTGH